MMDFASLTTQDQTDLNRAVEGMMRPSTPIMLMRCMLAMRVRKRVSSCLETHTYICVRTFGNENVQGRLSLKHGLTFVRARHKHTNCAHHSCAAAAGGDAGEHGHCGIGARLRYGPLLLAGKCARARSFSHT